MVDRIVNVAERLFMSSGAILKASILQSGGLGSRDIAALVAEGYIKKIKSGIYFWSDLEGQISDEEYACGAIPKGVIYLYSAAQFHDLSTINPMSISMAVPINSIRTQLPKYPPIRLFPLFSHFELGIQTVQSPHGQVRVYNKERTICDFFRNRNKIGEDIAREVVKSYMNGTDKNLQQLMEYASILTDKNALKPYVEALI